LVPSLKDNPKVTVIEGTFEDEEGLKKAAASGATIFVSFAGPILNSKGTVGLSPSSLFGYWLMI